MGLLLTKEGAVGAAAATAVGLGGRSVEQTGRQTELEDVRASALERWRYASEYCSIHASSSPWKLPKEYSLTKLVGAIRARVEYKRSSLISLPVSRRSSA